MGRFVLATLVAMSCALCLQEGPDAGQQPPSSEPTSQPATRPSLRHPVQARIYEELLRDAEQSRAAPLLPVDPETGRAAAETESRMSLLLEGTPLIERTGQLVRSGQRSEFRFEPGGLAGEMPDTMEILRNSWLEAMEREAEAGVQRFVISAEVTRYRDRNYLLLLKYRRPISHGNLGP
jgi:hypothetical protein